ncbi:MAG: hypothetical protein ACPGVT_08415 [Maricaulaceae bacterium]
MKNKLKITLVSSVAMFVTACGGGGASAPAPVVVTPPPVSGPTPTTPVTISGAATYDHVPFNTTTNGLNYANTQPRPIRGAVIEAVNGSGTVLDSTVSDASGNYSVTVDPNVTVRIRVKAQLLQTTGAKWDVRVTDNTSSNALYSAAGNLTSSGVSNSTRNLHAASGWTGSAYTETRVAAPFAILSPIYDTVTKFGAVDSNVDFPMVEFRWSTQNRAASGDVANGEIGTSSYVTSNGEGSIYILGDANSDTDEYDDHVVVHEWGHYFENVLSRSDSIGGAHGGGDALDSRVAMGEGWGNALSAMMTGDSFYRDSSGSNQSMGFSFDVEENNFTNRGWYSEASVQGIILDIFDSNNEAGDNVALGLGPIYDVMTSASYKASPVFTTIYGLLDGIEGHTPSAIGGINQLKSAQSIDGTGIYGTGETNSGGVASALPVFHTATVNGSALEVCSVNDKGSYNKLGNRVHIRLSVPATGSHTITMTRKSGLTARDPDFNIYKAGAAIAQGLSGTTDSETWTGNLDAGEYMIDAYDYNNTNQQGSASAGDSCYDFTVTQ